MSKKESAVEFYRDATWLSLTGSVDIGDAHYSIDFCPQEYCVRFWPQGYHTKPTIELGNWPTFESAKAVCCLHAEEWEKNPKGTDVHKLRKEDLEDCT